MVDTRLLRLADVADNLAIADGEDLQLIEFTVSIWDRERWPNFSFDEIVCRETGRLLIRPASMDRLQALRNEAGAINLSSAYRSPIHSAEKVKARPGSHTHGQAFDIKCWGEHATNIVAGALIAGFTGIGISQKHANISKRFVHIDDIEDGQGFHAPRPFLWSY